METISERCYHQGQSWYYKKVIAKAKKTFKIEIRRNAMDSQSYAKGFIYDKISSKWNEIILAPIMECECKKVSYIHKDVQPSVFANDTNRLLCEAIEITRS
jgi:hypothetical protein